MTNPDEGSQAMMIELAERCEKAAGPDRELDAGAATPALALCAAALRARAATVDAREACELRGERMHPSGLYMSEMVK